ncbi:hypothetical protein MAR_018715, partial [Mya arenaria]
MQCDTDPLIEENQHLREENERLTKELKMMKWGVNKIKDDDKATRFYSGLPTFAVFMCLYSFLLPKAKTMQYWNGANTPVKDRQKPQSSSLTLIEQLFAVLLRLKVGLLVQDIADRFSISNSSFSNIFITWICLSHEEMKVINVIPSRNIINETMPTKCTEIFIQRSSSLINQNLTFSNYKHHNTMKFLIGITPSGVISFVSEAWGSTQQSHTMEGLSLPSSPAPGHKYDESCRVLGQNLNLHNIMALIFSKMGSGIVSTSISCTAGGALSGIGATCAIPI